MGTLRCDYSLQLSQRPCESWDKTAVHIVTVGPETMTLCGACSAVVVAKARLYGYSYEVKDIKL